MTEFLSQQWEALDAFRDLGELTRGLVVLFTAEEFIELLKTLIVRVLDLVLMFMMMLH